MTDPDGAIEVTPDGPRFAFDRDWFADGVVEPLAHALSRSGVGVVILDADLRFVFANDVAADINGLAADEHIGRSMVDVVGKTALQITSMLRDILTTSEPVSGRELVGETPSAPGQIRTWLGDYEAVRRSGSTSPSADGILIVFSEVTEERRAERRLRQVIDGLFTFVGLCDADGTLVEVNDYAIAAAGIGVDDVVGRPFWECYWWAYDPAVQSLIRDAVARAAEGTSCRFDVYVRVAGGRLIPIDFQLVPVVEHGRVVSLVPSGVDIEARDQQMQRLAELSELSADLHHALSMHELVELIVGRASGIIGTSMVTVGVVDEATGTIRVTTPAELDPEIADRWDELTPDGPQTPFHTVAKTGEAVWVRTA